MNPPGVGDESPPLRSQQGAGFAIALAAAFLSAGGTKLLRAMGFWVSAPTKRTT